LRQSFSDRFRDELAIGKDLKVTVRMLRQHIEEVRMHERLSAENAKETVSMRFGIVDEAMKGGCIDHLSRAFDVDPAALAPQVARVNNGNVEKGGEIFTALDSPFETLDRQQPLDPKVPAELVKTLWPRGAQDSKGQSREHIKVSAVVCVRRCG